MILILIISKTSLKYIIISTEINNKQIMATANNNLGVCWNNNENYTNAINYYNDYFLRTQKYKDLAQ